MHGKGARLRVPSEPPSELRDRLATGQDSHGLWPGLARPRARIPTASGQGCSRLKVGVSEKAVKHISNHFGLFLCHENNLNIAFMAKE